MQKHVRSACTAVYSSAVCRRAIGKSLNLVWTANQMSYCLNNVLYVKVLREVVSYWYYFSKTLVIINFNLIFTFYIIF